MKTNENRIKIKFQVNEYRCNVFLRRKYRAAQGKRASNLKYSITRSDAIIAIRFITPKKIATIRNMLTKAPFCSKVKVSKNSWYENESIKFELENILFVLCIMVILW